MSQSYSSFSQDKSSHLSSHCPVDWREICRGMLQETLPISPLRLQPKENRRNHDPLPIILEKIKLPNQLPLSNGSTSVSVNAKIDVLDQLLQSMRSLDKQKSKEQKIAILGKPGSGKTFLLQTIAYWLLEETDSLPIWISPHQLKTDTIQNYLFEKWLVQASNHYHSPENISQTTWQTAFEQLLKSGKVWFFVDGIDYLVTSNSETPKQSHFESLLSQLQDITGNIRLILTCQTQTGKSESRSLSRFDVYQTQPLRNEEQVQQFIKQWFQWHQKRSDSSPTQTNLAQQLSDTLNHPERQHLQQWLKTPLHLSLLCHFWQKDPHHLPQTSFQLYQVLVNEFAQRQTDLVPITPQQTEQLHQWLAKLAWKHQQTAQASPTLSQTLIQESLGDNPSLLSLAVELNYLSPIGIVTANGYHDYVFCDPIFQDYFAASAINDGKDFFDQTHIPRILSHQSWQRILRFWLGREDIVPEQKEALIKALVTFEDGCGNCNFYGLKAYLMAAANLSEFPQCTLAQDIVQQVLTWFFEESALTGLNGRALGAKETLNSLYRPLAVKAFLDLISQEEDEFLQKQALQRLSKLAKGNEAAIAALTQLLETVACDTLRQSIAQTLGVIDPGNPQAIAVFVALLEHDNNETRQGAFIGLEKIGRGNLRAIKALVPLLYTQSSASIRRRAFQCLETVGQGNATAIAILVQLIRTTQDRGIRRQAAESLEKIDPGNPTAVAVLVQLTAATIPEGIRQEAVYSLGEVTPGNQPGITALVDLLQEGNDLHIRWIAISSLGKIGGGNPSAIATLEKLINSGESLILRKEALDSLGKIDPKNPKFIQMSIELIEGIEDESTHREIAESLGKLDPGNPAAIKALTKILQTSTDEFTRRRAAASLGQIDSGNLEALKTLIHLIQSTHDPDIRSLAAESLGQIGVGNPAAIATLIRLLETSADVESCRCGAKSLSQIAPGNKEAIAILVKRLQSNCDPTLGFILAESLTNLVSRSQMSQIIAQLRDHLLKDSDPESSPCYQILWHCAQSLPYRTFYQAWHQRTLPKSTVSSRQSETRSIDDAVPVWLETLQKAIATRSQFNAVHFIWIDSSRFIDANNPAIDIYDQMLEQHCEKFQHGLPETMAKLRLYWHLLQREGSHKTLILLFYEGRDATQTTHLSPHLIDILSKFRGAIAVISQQQRIGLPMFSPKDPQFVSIFLDWIETQL